MAKSIWSRLNNSTHSGWKFIAEMRILRRKQSSTTIPEQNPPQTRRKYHHLTFSSGEWWTFEVIGGSKVTAAIFPRNSASFLTVWQFELLVFTLYTLHFGHTHWPGRCVCESIFLNRWFAESNIFWIDIWIINRYLLSQHHWHQPQDFSSPRDPRNIQTMQLPVWLCDCGIFRNVFLGAEWRLFFFFF